MIKMIWAMDESFLIGDNNRIPWHVKEDLIYYKNTTKNSIVVMGYNTYKSLLFYYKDKPFPYKETYVLTDKRIDDSRVKEVYSIDDVLNIKEDLFIVGGASLYKQFYPYASYLYISYIKGIHKGDTYIDFLKLDEFNLVSEKNTDMVRYTIYQRKK